MPMLVKSAVRAAVNDEYAVLASDGTYKVRTGDWDVVAVRHGTTHFAAVLQTSDENSSRQP